MEINVPIFDWSTLGAIGIIGIAGLVVLLIALFTKSIKLCMTVSVLGIAGAMLYTVLIWGTEKTGFGGMIIIDNFSLILYMTILAGTLLTIFLSYELLTRLRPVKGEYLTLILFAAFGMMIMVSAGDMMMIFLGLESLSIALYILAGIRRNDEYSLESSFKYFLLGAFASGFLLFGMSFMYGATGTTSLAGILNVIETGSVNSQYFLTIGSALLIIGLGFKVALVPFHMWTPDVYDGAPTPVTAFMSTGVKAAAFAVLLRVFYFSTHSFFGDIQGIFWILAVLTMTVGNVIALSQNKIKRMLAYSSIAHAGYILVPFAAGTNEAAASIVYYLLTYTFMNIGAFGFVTYFENKDKGLYTLDSIAGMGFKRPVLAAGMTIFMFSLAGIPPTAGFFAKFYAFRAAVSSGFIWLAVIGVMNSVVSVYYYLRVVLNLYMKESDTDFSAFPFKASDASALTISVIGVFILGLFPSIFMALLTFKLF